MSNYTVDWTSPHATLWQRVLGKFRGQPNINALEIGTYEGRSACWFMDNILTHASSRLTCVDPWVSDRLPAVEAEAKWDTNTAPYGKRIHKIKLRSAQFLQEAAVAGGRYDWIYVDGNHQGDAALTDIVLAWQLLKVGGVLIIDDTSVEYSLICRRLGYPSPSDAANAFLRCFAGKYTRLHNNEQVVVEKSHSTYVSPLTNRNNP